jgi:hypothetical protein
MIGPDWPLVEPVSELLLVIAPSCNDPRQLSLQRQRRHSRSIDRRRFRPRDVSPALGSVEAPDQRKAYRLAIEKFNVPIERQNRLFVVKIGKDRHSLNV